LEASVSVLLGGKTADFVGVADLDRSLAAFTHPKEVGVVIVSADNVVQCARLVHVRA
jgi:hypothetical protein